MAGIEVANDVVAVGSSGLLSDKVVLELATVEMISEDWLMTPLKMDKMDGVVVAEDTDPEPLSAPLVAVLDKDDAVPLVIDGDGKEIIGELDWDEPLCEIEAELPVTDAESIPEVWVTEALPDILVAVVPDEDCA